MIEVEVRDGVHRFDVVARATSPAIARELLYCFAVPWARVGELHKVDRSVEGKCDAGTQTVTYTQFVPFGEGKEFLSVALLPQEEDLTGEAKLFAPSFDACRGKDIGRRGTSPVDTCLLLTYTKEGVRTGAGRERKGEVDSLPFELKAGSA